MKIILTKKPKNPTIIEGFPGFGLVGTITTEYLINTLNAKKIGLIYTEEIQPMVAIHEGKMVSPIGIYHDEKTNLVILHIMTNVKGIEWEMGDFLLQLGQELKATELISIEGVGTPVPTEESKAYHYSNANDSHKKFLAAKIPLLQEGIILGVTATLLLQAKDFNVSCIFIETHSSLPDSKASAKAIEVLDKYLDLKIDYKPLLAEAEKFEKKIRSIMEQGEMAKVQAEKKNLSYVG
ncbi:proteasome assembly chaperone family protein [Candidatus Woesearchaeota archaeon]|nr:proteasome assembly chaperone family protein [Candidatus Woesearchaeota archaeon]